MRRDEVLAVLGHVVGIVATMVLSAAVAVATYEACGGRAALEAAVR